MPVHPPAWGEAPRRGVWQLLVRRSISCSSDHLLPCVSNDYVRRFALPCWRDPRRREHNPRAVGALLGCAKRVAHRLGECRGRIRDTTGYDVVGEAVQKGFAGSVGGSRPIGCAAGQHDYYSGSGEPSRDPIARDAGTEKSPPSRCIRRGLARRRPRAEAVFNAVTVPGCKHRCLPPQPIETILDVTEDVEEIWNRQHMSCCFRDGLRRQARRIRRPNTRLSPGLALA